MTDNPYQSPLSDQWQNSPFRNGASAENKPLYKLFNSWHMALATFLGSPLAAGILIAINYRRLHRSGAALHAVVWSFLGTAVLIVTLTFLPDLPVPDILYTVPQIVVMYWLSEKLFRVPYSEHRRWQGRWSSSWAAAGIGLLTGMALGLAIVATIAMLVMFWPELLPAEWLLLEPAM